MSSEPAKPSTPPYDRHIFVCVGQKCHPCDGMAVYEHLKASLKKSASDPAIRRVKRSQSQCLTVCQGGPIAVVYPDGIWYCHLTKEKIDRIVQEHLKEGRPVQEWTFCPQKPSVPENNE